MNGPGLQHGARQHAMQWKGEQARAGGSPRRRSGPLAGTAPALQAHAAYTWAHPEGTSASNPPTARRLEAARGTATQPNADALGELGGVARG